MSVLVIDFYKLLISLSMALDFNRQGILRHHVRVALMAMQIARQLDMSAEEREQLVCAALIHDLGVSTFNEKSKLAEFEVKNTFDHCRRGYQLAESSPLLKPQAEIILCHHDRWIGGNSTGLRGSSIPLAARIIHLADRVDVLINENTHILQQRKHIIGQIKPLSGVVFDPTLVDVLLKLSERESFWLDIVNNRVDLILKANIDVAPRNVYIEDLLSISEVFARVIDAKSSFTHRHSRLVAAVSGRLAKLAGFTDEQCRAMRVAGLLHDLGKMAIPEEILEKPGRLTAEEYNIIKGHTYYTYQILDMLDGFETIKCWAAYHHEKPNGQGYPFKIDASGLDAGSRLLAVSDVFAALVENRPYRHSLPRHKVEQILVEMAKQNELDRTWVELLLEHYHEIRI